MTAATTSGRAGRGRKARADAYGLKDKGPQKFFSSGSTGLDCVNNGGWAAGRVINIVGDRSTGKTLLAIEASANFKLTWPTGEVHYIECEEAFDVPYARSLGLPLSDVVFPNKDQLNVSTVEEFNAYMEDLIAKRGKKRRPTLVVLDSLDALSDSAELDRKITDGSYGGTKPKKLSEFFRRNNQLMAKLGITLIIVSQLRDKLGVMFGDKHTRTGGRALDFYATQVVWLSQIKQLQQQRIGVKRVYGILVRAKNKKNKVGPPFREFDFPVLFNFGIEDLQSTLGYILERKAWKRCKMTEKELKDLANKTQDLSPERWHRLRAKSAGLVQRLWQDVEREFAPTFSKYGS